MYSFLHRSIFIVVVLFVPSITVCMITEKLDTYLQACARLNRFNGSVAVAEGDNVLLNKGYGVANYSYDIPNAADTKFRICSITKMVTAACILQLQEKNKLNVNDTLDRYFSDYPRGNEISIHHLLSHTSGIFSGGHPLEMNILPTKLKALINYCKDKPLEFQPGTDYRYSNTNYLLLSSIVKKVSGKTYESFVSENILVPLGMKDSLFVDHDHAIIKNAACGYVYDEEHNLVNGHLIYDHNYKGSGSLLCTAGDLCTFIKALDEGKIINAESLSAMRQQYSNQENYGYGCSVGETFGEKSVQHGGLLSNGFKSIALTIPSKKIYVVILGNMCWLNELCDDLVAIALGKNYHIPSEEVIEIDSALYDDYVGIYNHPEFEGGYKVKKLGKALCTSDGRALYPVQKDEFIDLERKNMLYKFVRNESGAVGLLKIQGCGGAYFVKGCSKKI